VTALAILVAAAAVSWLLRVLFIAVVPASRLPAGLRRVLDHTGTVVMAALIATELGHDGGVAALVVPSGPLLALLAAGAVAWRTRHLAAAVATAVVVGGVLALLGLP